MSRITKIKKESLTTKLTLIVIGLTAASGLLVPATYASFHPVTSGEIADETIQSRDIRNGQVGSVDIAERTIRRGDVGVGALNPVLQIVFSDSKIVTSTAATENTVDCPSGYRVTGGGINADTFLTAYDSWPLDVDTWQVGARNDHPSATGDFRAYAVCMGPIPP